MNITRTSVSGATLVALAAGLVTATPAAADDIDPAPSRTVTGGLSQPIGIERDGAGNIYLANQANDAIVVHAHNASGASGPLRTISGALTGLSAPRDVALDANGFIYAVNSNGSVRVFGPGQDGNVTPVKTFGTGPGNAWGIDIGPGGEIYVRKQSSYQVYSPSATGSPAPTKREVTGLSGGRSIVVAGTKVWTPSGGQLRAYARGADGAAAPLQTVVNAVDPFDVNGIDVDAKGRVYVGNWTSRTVKVFAGNAGGATAPLKVIGGPATGLDRPTGVSVLASGQFVVADYTDGSYSVFAKLFDDRAKPGKVRSVKVKGTSKAKKRTIVWKAPKSDGGAKITAYRVVVRKGNKTLLTKNVKGSQRKLVVKRGKLRKGTHVVTIRAKNVKGAGPVATKKFKVKK